jgi:predicted RNase H-like nuclease (RuvC/YqgF family)
MKHDERKQLSARFSDKIRNKFNEVSENYPELTDQQIIETIIDNCNSDTSVDSNLLAEYEQKISSLATQVQQLEDCANEIEDLRAANESLHIQIAADNSSSTDYDEKIHKLQLKLDTAQKEANENARLLQQKQHDFDLLKKQSSEPVPGMYTVRLDDMADELMQITVNRLQDMYNDNTITAEKILTDLFVKYTAKRPSDFAYPLVIKSGEVQLIASKHRKK